MHIHILLYHNFVTREARNFKKKCKIICHYCRCTKKKIKTCSLQRCRDKPFEKTCTIFHFSNFLFVYKKTSIELYSMDKDALSSTAKRLYSYRGEDDISFSTITNLKSTYSIYLFTLDFADSSETIFPDFTEIPAVCSRA